MPVLSWLLTVPRDTDNRRPWHSDPREGPRHTSSGSPTHDTPPSEPPLIPKLRSWLADFPYPHSSIRLEAAHLGDLLRIIVRQHKPWASGRSPRFSRNAPDARDGTTTAPPQTERLSLDKPFTRALLGLRQQDNLSSGPMHLPLGQNALPPIHPVTAAEC